MTTKSCLKSRPWFSDALDGVRVPGWRGAIVRLHLTVCPACRRYHRSLTATRDAVAALRDVDVELDQAGDLRSPATGKPVDQR